MEQIKKLKLNKKTILIIAFIGVVLMLIGNFGTTDNTSDSSDEARLEAILSQIEGVGNVKVMLSVNEQKTSALYQQTDTCGYIGAVVLADGGGKSEVKEKIIKAVTAVTGLDAHKIVVYRLGN